MKKTIRIVSRRSPLALWQAEFVKAQLEAEHATIHCVIVGVATEGDKILDTPLFELGGKGLFVKELEEYLLSDRADLAVHSMKDMPAQLPSGLVIGALLERENPLDVFVSEHFENIYNLPPQSSIGTSSLRRSTQLAALRSDLHIQPLRGNVDTRLNKLKRGDYAGLILAAAGLHRLERREWIRTYFQPEAMLPAVAQGVLGIECAEQRQDIRDLVAPLHHEKTAVCVQAERAMNAALGGGVQFAHRWICRNTGIG